MATLSLSQFVKSYGGNTVLTIPELHLHPGIYWVRGENGSGKTSLFRSLAGLLPCQGQIRFDDGIDLHDHPTAYRMRVNYSEAEPLYPGFLTAKDLVSFVGKAKKSPRDQQHDLIRKFGIDAYFEKPSETYSSGMMKKLSLALAFLGNPSLVILDEPLITLDDHAREILLQQIRKGIEANVTFLVSSHQLFQDGDLPINSTFLIANKTLVRS